MCEKRTNLHQDLAAYADNFCRRFVGGLMEMANK